MTFDIATQLGATIGRQTPTSFDMATRTGAAITVDGGYSVQG